MQSKNLLSLIFLSALLVMAGCKQKPKEVQQLSEVKYNKKVSAFTSGMVSNQAEIMVRFSEIIPEAEPGTPASSSIMKISPSVKGEFYWIDNQSLGFKAEDKLSSGTVYNVKVKLGQIFKDTKDDFEFSFQTITQNFRLEVGEVSPYDNANLTDNQLSGKLILSDFAELEQVHQVLKANQKGKELEIEWLPSERENNYPFKVQHITRGESSSSVTLELNGESIGVDEDDSEKIKIPSINDFELLTCKSVFQPRQGIEISFTDPLNPDQELAGLIELDRSISYNTQVEDNIIKILPNNSLSGTVKVTVHPGIENILGTKSDEKESFHITFTSSKPQVEFLGKGTILPESSGLTLPFRAVSLKEVQVRVIKIFENNVGAFLQVNKLDGSYQLKRAGRLVLKKTIPLNTDRTLDLNKWNTFSINLDDMVKVDRGAIYRVELQFARRNAIYPCSNEDESSDAGLESNPDEITEGEIAYYDSPNGGNSYYDNDYYYYGNWNDREDPCKRAYYRKSRFASRNILASNIGIIAKKGADKEMLVAVTDLRSTDPLAGVDVEIYNYQNQLISSAKSNSEGLVRIDVTKRPYLLIAKHENQRGYLRLDGGSSLSLSRFDVAGQTIDKGLKGYIYGERGVWRPGDTLFVSFILEDREKTLPENHPVVFELTNPHGQLVKRMATTDGVNNMYLFKVNTEDDAPTGNWQARFLVGGTSFNKTLKVETVKPNRLKIKMDFGVEMLSVAKPYLSANMEVKWLHGAVAKNLEANVTATLTSIPTRFKRFNDYAFDDPTRSFTSEEVTFFEGDTDAEGMAKVQGNLEVSDQAPGMLKASFRTRVFEESGDYSIDRFSIPYSPYKSYVGVKAPVGDKRGMLLTDKEHAIEVASVNSEGNPISKSKLKYVVYKVNWRWWWESGEDNLARYVSSSSQDVVSKGTLSTKDGIGSFNMEIKYPAWGRYLIRVFDPESGHVCGRTVYVDWPGYAAKPVGENSEAATMLTLSTEEDKYTVGQKAQVNFASSEGGRALVSIENGTRIVKEYWVKTQKEFTSFSFEVSKEMTPNIYVHVTLLQPHAQTANNMPIRMYGVTPLLVEDAETHLKPVIDMPESLVPESLVKIKVSEANGKAMTYTVAMVEEGLLDLTRFKTPQPWNHFYAREALGVRTWDVYNQVIGAYGGQIEKVFSIGGDGDLANKQKDPNANRFKPVVKVFGPFELKKGATETHEFKMPQYIGSVRTMVVARNERMYGNAEKATPVKKPLMVLATLPRVLGPGETVKLPITVFAMRKDIKKVNLTIETNDLLNVKEASKQTITFDKEGDMVVPFTLEIPKKLGVGKVKIIAKSGSEEAIDEIEIQVRNPNPPRVTSASKMLKANESASIPYTLFGMEGTNNATIEVSSIPPVDFGRRLKYLLRYPHGCVEQTTSSVFPQLFLGNVMELDDNTKATIEKNIKAGISRLATFITADGGMSYWPGNTSSNDWGSSYAGHFLLEAEKKGYSLPINFKSKWISYQKRQASSWVGTGSGKYKQLNQAYRLYTLALAEKPEKSAMNRMRNMADLSAAAKWRLAAAYALIGQKDVATTLVEGQTIEVVDRNYYYYSYGSVTRDQAMILETLALLGDLDTAAPLMKEIASQLSSQRWMSTQTTAYSLIALSQLTANTGGSRVSYTYSGSGINKEKISSDKPVNQIQLPADIPVKGEVKFENHADGVMFARLVLEGTPFKGDSISESSNLKMSVKYKTLSGESVDVSRLAQGSDFMAVVTVTHPGQLSNYKDMALTQIFPSGWEIRNTRMEDVTSSYEMDIPDYRDIRDDRVYSYFDLSRNKSKTFVVILNATYQGRYYLPSVSCEAMYNNQITSRKAGQWVEVIGE
ncbi:alpha-2-macroglobulin family protein [Labilibacter marinus]|uniref:alpha-2-macroglobulin family protein n=1 Tax=Labilibacter marinus TaxID=1477105 RepID=UPI0008313C65|nr:MG2 domain-containing protein [Labilibacter marinus]